MNRLLHLKETLPINIKDNSDYDNLEFIILDYNSKDGLKEWIQLNMAPLILSGRVVYYKTEYPSFFHRSHSRNMAFRLANGDILCNIDADNYTGNGFASYINKQFQGRRRIVLTSIDFHKKKKNYHPPSDTYGRIGFRREDFYAIEGYDENMVTHGFQDYDFVNRLELAGSRRVFIDDLRYLTAISHSNEDRLSNESQKYALRGLFIRPINHIKSQILYLYKQGSFDEGIIIDNRAKVSDSYREATKNDGMKYAYSVENGKWKTGLWQQTGDLLELEEQDTNVLRKFEILLSQDTGVQLISLEDNFSFKEITDTQIIIEMLLFNRQIANRSWMIKNYKQKNIIVNKNRIGKGVVYKNFNNLEKIYLT